MAGAGIAKRIPALLFLCPIYGVHHGALRARFRDVRGAHPRSEHTNASCTHLTKLGSEAPQGNPLIQICECTGFFASKKSKKA